MPIKFYKLYLSKDKALNKTLYNILGFVPTNTSIYELALRHNSSPKTQRRDGLKNNNERLEFLGDAVLSCVIAEKLYKKFPYKDEGFLTELRSKIVSREKLGQLARKMGLHTIIEYDKLLQNTPNFLPQISGNALEAIIGAMYLDKGYHFAMTYINKKIVDHHIDINELMETEISYKGKLYKWSQKNRQTLEIVIKSEERHGGKRLFEMAVMVEGKEIVSEKNYSKKRAEELACEKACSILAV
ncbi:MAG: ribonuclease III [Bacteroidia bacterium]|nr:ribonuclease III [Bacteroidia bacterium]